ncbi:DUF4234 domain-containing protein [Candidatus Woesearchaeota archaeon]|nr:DUF4234 domain-containing protein [Candidatus Woesearchaeota archaeon]
MVNNEVVEYIKRHKSKGFSEDQIRNVLIEHGHSARNVKEAMKIAGGEAVKKTTEIKEKPIKRSGNIIGIKRRNPFLVFLFSFITAGVYYIYWLASTTNELRKNSMSAPNPWLILLFFVPFVNIIVSLIYYWKYSKAVNEITGFSTGGLFVLWIFFWPIAMILSQIELNKNAM